MNDLKYLIVVLKGMTTSSAIVFRGCISHIQVVPQDSQVISGGLCNIGVDLSIKVFGNAKSIDDQCKSRVIDAKIIEQTLLQRHSYVNF